MNSDESDQALNEAGDGNLGFRATEPNLDNKLFLTQTHTLKNE